MELDPEPFNPTQHAENEPSLDSKLALIYFNGRVTNSPEGVKFHCYYPRRIRINEDTSLHDLKRMVHAKLQAGSKIIAHLYYRCPEKTPEGGFHFSQMTLSIDADIRRMFAVFNEHRRAGPIELYARLERSTDEILALLRGPSGSGGSE